MTINDSYLKPRKDITENWDSAHLLEVNGFCPLCGKYLLKQKNTRMNKHYQIAHIYPNSPNKHQLKELDGLERLGKNCEDYANKIALCMACHSDFDSYTTKPEYLHLVELKKTLLNTNSSKISLSRHDIEPQLEQIISDLSIISNNDLKDLKLKYTALKISQKIEDDFILLKIKIENYVCIYYRFIQEQFRNLENSGEIDFETISRSIRLAFLKSSKEASKGDIFNVLVEWLMNKTTNKSREACEIIISFFIQNCEVFNEIPK